MRRPGGAAALIVSAIALAAGCRGVAIEKVARRSSAVLPAGRHDGPARGAPPPRPAPRAGANPLDPDDLLDRADASYRAGRGAERASKDVAARFQLDALVGASGAVAALESEPGERPGDPRLPGARALYGSALRDFLRVTSGRRVRLDRDWRDGLAARGIAVDVLRDGSTWEPERFDEFLFADDYSVKRLDHQFRAEGVGVPLIGLRKFSLKDLEGREGEEKFLMPRQVYPVTAMLRVVPGEGGPSGPTRLRLELHDPLRARRVGFEGGMEPLAADLTTPLAYHFTRSALPILQEIGLLDPQWLEKLAGLYMLHPYEPGKIPVVFVHGLRSSPAAWMKVLNDLRGDPAIRDRFQFWLFLYPTGTPFPFSAAKLRKGLDELREVVDPGHDDPALDRSVLIGHSMGGLISRMMISESGDALWKLVGRRPFEELQATPERKEMIRRVFFFGPHPSIRRVVFVATPHRGSELGDRFIGRLADRLIRLPNPLRVTYRALMAQNGPDFFTPEIRSGVPSSIDELRTDSRLLLTLAGLPVGPGVAVHSIIGSRDPADPVRQSSDGVVPYSSSHLDWAASERVVEGDHGCQDTPETIAEIRRILLLHLGQVARDARAPLDPEVRRMRPLRLGPAPAE